METLYNKIYDALYYSWNKKSDSQKKDANYTLKRILYDSDMTIRQAEEIVK
jgi:hypothetical protein